MSTIAPGRISALLCGIWVGALIHYTGQLLPGPQAQPAVRFVAAVPLLLAGLLPFWYLVLSREFVLLRPAHRKNPVDSEKFQQLTGQVAERLMLFLCAVFAMVVGNILLRR